jgi:cytochrome oxidase Cu insertion factor (SCO1/SenC/PrrC family)
MRIHWPLISLSLMFLAPAAAAGYILLYPDKINFPTAQHGKLISPPQTTSIAATDKWQIVYIQPQQCNLECEQQQKILHNVHTALGANQPRVALVTMTNDQLLPNIKDNSVLIINPQGLYILHYEAGANHMGLLKDLRRLLKYSHA